MGRYGLLSCIGLTLWLVVVHAILASQRLDEVLQRKVTTHIVTAANRALDLRGIGNKHMPSVTSIPAGPEGVGNMTCMTMQ